MKRNKFLVVALLALAMLALSISVGAQATPIAPPTFDETLEGITTLAVNFNVAVVIFIAVVIGGAAYLYRRMTKAAR